MLTLIENVTLRNYKQFAGINQIEFSTDSKQNVTLVQGSNGAGKSNLLEAMEWCINGRKSVQRTESRQEPSLISWQIADSPRDKTLAVSVGINVRQGADKFLIQRQTNYKKARNQLLEERNKEKLTINRIHKNPPSALSDSRPKSRLTADLAIMPHYFSRWLKEFHYTLPKEHGAIRAAILELVPTRNNANKLQAISKESTNLFRRIVGKDSHFYTSTIKIGPSCELRMLKSGRNIVYSLASQELVALSFALLLAIVKVSGKRFPILLDSPFERLSKYKENIARILVSSNQQVIIMATDVELYGVRALSPRIGKQYIIKEDTKEGTSLIIPTAMVLESTKYAV